MPEEELKPNEYGVILQPTRQKANAYYHEIMSAISECGNEKKISAVLRNLCLGDLFFLLIWGLKCTFANIDWVFERCREVQKKPNNMLDLWSRGHFKSLIITFALTIQDILRNPELTVCIFSVSRPMAKQFLLQIKREFEHNELLLGLFPDVLWVNPQREADKWSEDEGLVVRRKGNPKEATLECFGLADDSQPTSKHYDLKIYDDVITEKNVTNPDMIYKAMEGIRLSMNLGKIDPVTGRDITVNRFVGTRWDLDDPYKQIVEDGLAELRERPGVYVDENGKMRSRGYWSDDIIEQKKSEMGDYIFSCQILLDPIAASAQKFRVEWLKYWDATNLKNLNLYIVVDPSGSSKHKKGDFTAINLFGVDATGNRMIIKLIRDKMNLIERANAVFKLVHEYRGVIRVGYEQFGMQSDIEHLRYRMDQENFRFEIVPLGIGGRLKGDLTTRQIPKDLAISSLVSQFSTGRIYLPYECLYTDYTGRTRDMVKVFIEEEYSKWYPKSNCHDDMLDTIHMMFHEDLRVREPNLSMERVRRFTGKAKLGNVYTHEAIFS